MTTLYKIEEVSGLYADAVVGNDYNELRFFSVWGLDTAIQEFLSRLSLPWKEGGLIEVKLQSLGTEETERWYSIGNAEVLEKYTGRSLSKHTLFHGLVHLWVYHPAVYQVDYVNRRCLLLKQQTEDPEMFDQRLWEAVKTVCPVPLLEGWKMIVEDFREQGWICHHEGLQVDAYELDFSAEDMAQTISLWIKQGKYMLPKERSYLSLVKP